MVQRHLSIADPDDEENLLVYAPLLEGTRFPFKFFNYVNGKSMITSRVETEFLEGKLSVGPLTCPF